MDKSTDRIGPITVALVTLAVLATLFAMREAQAIVVPILTAFFLALVAESPVQWLDKKGLPRIPAILLVVAAIGLALTVIGILIGTSVQQLSERAPAYQERFRAQIDMLLSETGNLPFGIDLAGIVNKISPDASLSLASAVLNSVTDLFSNAFLILLMMILMLLEVPSFVTKIDLLGGSHGTWLSIAKSVRGYLGIKTLTSLATGILVAIMLAAMGIDFAILWGLLAFLLNYIPNIGSLLAAIPAILLALLVDGFTAALIVTVGYLLINGIIGNVVEPRIMGEGLGLSTVVVFISLILWGWLLGPVGMLLSVPITTTLKIVLETNESTRPLALLLGSGKVPAS